jgi:hypothetical protein
MKYEIRDTKYEIRLPVANYFPVLLLLLLLSSVPSVHAAWYQVEAIIFEQLRPDLGGEVWFENPGLPLRDDSIELITEVPDMPAKVKEIESESEQDDQAAEKEELIPYLQLPADSMRLQKDLRILKLSAEYRPLLHVSWQQPGYDNDNGLAVHLDQILELEEPGDALPPELAEIQIEADNYVVPKPVFDGTIRIRTTRFLHVDVDIAYFPRDFPQLLRLQKQGTNNPDQLEVNQEADYVRLTESRKIKLNELHYFDHPLFGVLLQVSRLKE